MGKRSRVDIRLDEHEKAALQLRAKQANKTLTEYLLGLVENDEVVRDRAEAIREHEKVQRQIAGLDLPLDDRGGHEPSGERVYRGSCSRCPWVSQPQSSNESAMAAQRNHHLAHHAGRPGSGYAVGSTRRNLKLYERVWGTIGRAVD